MASNSIGKPFLFLGLILGDYTIGCLWSIIGIVFEIPTYGVWLGKIGKLKKIGY